ncbi:hypothetical protein AJ87_48800 [Rhizobium yanglingense]|nr:hypothetical protein AJ87_48800 [Rhizobium yanglingense]
MIDGYVDISSDRVRLSTRGENAFNPASGELEALDIEAFADTVPLDLISFSPVDTAGGARMPWLSELEIKDKTAAAAATSAGEHGFRTNFGEWRDRKFKGGSASMVRLQTMDVTPLARFTTPISVPVNYAPSISDAIEPDFSKLRDKGRRGSREKLIDALSQALRGIAAPTDQYAAAEITARGIMAFSNQRLPKPVRCCLLGCRRRLRA